MLKKKEKILVEVDKDQINALYSIYKDICGFVENNKEYQDVSKAEKDADRIKAILDQVEGDFEYRKGY